MLDTACAKIAIGQNATPARIEDAKRRLDVLATERAQLEKEAAGSDHGKRLGEIAEESAKVGEAWPPTKRASRRRRNWSARSTPSSTRSRP